MSVFSLFGGPKAADPPPISLEINVDTHGMPYCFIPGWEVPEGKSEPDPVKLEFGTDRDGNVCLLMDSTEVDVNYLITSLLVLAAEAERESQRKEELPVDIPAPTRVPQEIPVGALLGPGNDIPWFTLVKMGVFAHCQIAAFGFVCTEGRLPAPRYQIIRLTEYKLRSMCEYVAQTSGEAALTLGAYAALIAVAIFSMHAYASFNSADTPDTFAAFSANLMSAISTTRSTALGAPLVLQALGAILRNSVKIGSGALEVVAQPIWTVPVQIALNCVSRDASFTYTVMHLCVGQHGMVDNIVMYNLLCFLVLVSATQQLEKQQVRRDGKNRFIVNFIATIFDKDLNIIDSTSRFAPMIDTFRDPVRSMTVQGDFAKKGLKEALRLARKKTKQGISMLRGALGRTPDNLTIGEAEVRVEDGAPEEPLQPTREPPSDAFVAMLQYFEGFFNLTHKTKDGVHFGVLETRGARGCAIVDARSRHGADALDEAVLVPYTVIYQDGDGQSSSLQRLLENMYDADNKYVKWLDEGVEKTEDAVVYKKRLLNPTFGWLKDTNDIILFGQGDDVFYFGKAQFPPRQGAGSRGPAVFLRQLNLRPEVQGQFFSGGTVFQLQRKADYTSVNLPAESMIIIHEGKTRQGIRVLKTTKDEKTQETYWKSEEFLIKQRGL